MITRSIHSLLFHVKGSKSHVCMGSNKKLGRGHRRGSVYFSVRKRGEAEMGPNLFRARMIVTDIGL